MHFTNLRGDVYILNRQGAASYVHPTLVVCRVLCAKVVDATTGDESFIVN